MDRGDDMAIRRRICPVCRSGGFPHSLTGKGCTFCDGTESGNSPIPGVDYVPSSDALTTDMPTVYLIAQPTVAGNGSLPKLEPLAEWGTIKVLINPGEDPRYNPKLAMKRIRSRLADFNPELDFLAWAGGDTLAAVLTGVVLADFAIDEEDPFDSFQWLRWERGRDASTGKRTEENGKYVRMTVPLFLDNDATISPDPMDPITHDGVTP